MESAFTSAFRVLTRIEILPFDKFPNIAKIKKVRCPVLLIHGREDDIVNFYHGQVLFAAANEPKRSYWVEQAGHNDLALVAGRRYFEELRNFADSIDRAH
jgi:fermentation-respiration switch protein FrsA (DUF1100 family)